MRKILLPILFIAFSVDAQEQRAIDLIWKISDTLTYKTVMKDVVVEEKIEKISPLDATAGGEVKDLSL